MVQTPSTTLLSSGRKEYSATKITAYFSPKPSPVASPPVQVQAQAGDTKGEVAADMAVETRKRVARSRTTSEARTNGVQQPETPAPAAAPSPSTQIATEHKPNGTPAKSSKNVDKVVYGDLLFDCTYTSRHVREIIGDKVAEGKDVLDRLCVCPHCFKYTQEIVKYLGHIKVCPRRKGGSEGMVPGKMVYKHGESWEVWEVDGEDDQVRIACSCPTRFRRVSVRTKLIYHNSYTAKISPSSPSSFLAINPYPSTFHPSYSTSSYTAIQTPIYHRS